MSEKLKIKLSIANRVYPLTISPDQEEGLRKAAQKIEAMIVNSGVAAIWVSHDPSQIERLVQFEQTSVLRFEKTLPSTYL